MKKYIVAIKSLDFKVDFDIKKDQTYILNRLFDVLNEHFDLDIYYNAIENIEYE